MIKVVNKYYHISTPNDVYIGRGSTLGNPYTHLTGKTKAQFICETRAEAIEAYKNYLKEALLNKDKVICDALNTIYKQAKNGDINLVCYCKLPNKFVSCHGDFIKELIMDKLKNFIFFS